MSKSQWQFQKEVAGVLAEVQCDGDCEYPDCDCYLQFSREAETISEIAQRYVLDNGARITALETENARLRERNAELEKIYASASCFWDADDPEYGWSNPWDIVDESDSPADGVPHEIQRGGVVETRFYVSMCDDPETGEPWRRNFATEREALDAVKAERARRAALGDDA